MPAIGQSITILQSVESTNNYAMAKIHAGLAIHGDSYLALEQTGGKGQRGKSWRSSPGENITISVILEPGTLTLYRQFELSIAISLACYDLFNNYAGIGTSIKWPNDIYWRDRKAGGILLENIVHGSNWRWAVVGIGLNINQAVFPEHLPNPVSLSMVSGKAYDIIQLAKELCNALQERFEQAQKLSPAFLLDVYNRNLYMRGKTVALQRNGRLFKTQIRGVDQQGRLVTGEGTFSSGEVSFSR